MNLTDKIANALQNLIAPSPVKEAKLKEVKQAELTKEIPLDAELKLWTGVDLDFEDPQAVKLDQETKTMYKIQTIVKLFKTNSLTPDKARLLS